MTLLSSPTTHWVPTAMLTVSLRPVSYTHLDVYKRQGYEKEGMAEPLVRALQTMSSIDQMMNRNEEANVLLQRCV